MVAGVSSVEDFNDSEGAVFESMFPLELRASSAFACGRGVWGSNGRLRQGPACCCVCGPTPDTSGCVVFSDGHTSEAAAEAVAIGGLRKCVGTVDSLARAWSTTFGKPQPRSRAGRAARV